VTQTYRVVVLTADRQADADALAEALARHTLVAGNGGVDLEIGRARSELDDVGDPDAPPTVLVVVSGGKQTAEDDDVVAAADKCKRALVPVLPVVHDLRRYPAHVPPALGPVNGFAWPRGTPAGPVANAALRLVGLMEEDRRVFLSYRRTDATDLAEQFRTALGDQRWDVFLDRFSVPPAVDFQARLDRELADKAFVLLLESPMASASAWVGHELAFAVNHGLGLAALTLPGTSADQQFTTVDETFRIRLSTTDLTGAPEHERLTGPTLARLLVEVELRHAAAARLRRDQALTDALAELEVLGYEVDTVGERVLLAVHPRGGRREVVLVTGRAAVPADLRTAEHERRRARGAGAVTRGWVVHPTEDIDADRASLMIWLSRHRQVAPTPLMLLRARISA
jgi:hypothetical protein